MKARFEPQGVIWCPRRPSAFDAVLRGDADRYGKLLHATRATDEAGPGGCASSTADLVKNQRQPGRKSPLDRDRAGGHMRTR